MPRRILFLLPALLCAAGAARAQASDPCSNRPPSDPAYYADMKELPRGKWGLSSAFDMAQVNNAATPVVVRGLGSVSSQKQRAAKYSCVELENRSSRTVKSVTLRWVVTALGPDGAAVEGGPALSKGTLPVVEVEIPPGVRRKVELRDAHYADFLRPLIVNGELEGKYSVSVGVARVEYADGTAEDLP